MASHAQQQQSNQALAKHLETLHTDANLGDVIRHRVPLNANYAAIMNPAHRL